MQIQTLIVHPSRILQAALAGLIGKDTTFKVVTTVSSGLELIQTLETSSNTGDIVLLDPTLESPDLVSRISKVTDAKIILLTLDDESPLLDAWIKEGVRGVLGRDPDPSLLMRAITKVYAGEFWLTRAATSRLLSGLGGIKELTPEQARVASLTAKEKVVIKAIVHSGGHTLRDTARLLKISEHTVRNHLASVYSKLGVANRVELFVFAQQHIEL